MMHNRAAVMYGTHDVKLEGKPVPEPGPKDVLVEIKAVGVCGSDVHYYEEGRIGSFVVKEPPILGHESMGTVVALGDEATEHEVGDRVTLEPGIPDMTCRECRAATTSARTSASSRRLLSTERLRTTWRSMRTSRSRCRTTSQTTPAR
jgi:threonine dehydrogenase-like Zn-dependent dehydrogenase